MCTQIKSKMLPSHCKP